MVTYFHLEFPREIVTKPIMSDAIRKTGASINILRARIDETHGEIVAEVAGGRSEVGRIASYLRNRGVIVQELSGSVSVRVDGCTHCGACVSICPVKAISIGREYEVIFDASKCISCRVCIPVCPVRAIQAPPL